MDYRIRDKSKTAFTYVLPFKDNEALIEHTYFSKEECLKEVYEGYIREYLKKYYSISNYKIIKSEYGVIPMTTYPFYKHSTKNITKIGTPGGWVKPSTGYSFKNCEKYSKIILENYSIIYAGFLSGGIAFTLQMYAQKNIEEAPAAIIYSLEGVFATLAGWIILNQILNLNNIIGCFLILIAVILSQITPSFKTLGVGNKK